MASSDPVLLINRVVPPATSYAIEDEIVGTSSPVESIPVWKFLDVAAAYMDFYGVLSPQYSGGGVTLILPWSASVATNNVVWQAAFRAIPDDTEDLDTTAHTYDFNTVTDAAPSVIGEVVYPTIAFTDGADMDSLAAGEAFILRILRDPAHASDSLAATAYLHHVLGKET